MSNIGQSKMLRVLGRCAETRSGTTVDEVVSTYDDVLAPKATAFESAMAAALSATEANTSARDAMTAAVKAIRPFHEVARTIISLRVPAAEQPGALSSLTTDTDGRLAIQRTLDALTARRGESWADGLLAGPFGTMATPTIDKIKAAATAAGLLFTAQATVRETFDAVYPAFLGFKAIVRLKLGSTSPAYRRINVRGKIVVAEPAPAPTPEPLPVPAPAPEPAMVPSNGASHVLLSHGA